MAEVKIKTLKNGPLSIEGALSLVDHKGNAHPSGGDDKIYLCRCGQSKNKPFCDGSHADAGFQAEEMAG